MKNLWPSEAETLITHYKPTLLGDEKQTFLFLDTWARNTSIGLTFIRYLKLSSLSLRHTQLYLIWTTTKKTLYARWGWGCRLQLSVMFLYLEVVVFFQTSQLQTPVLNLYYILPKRDSVPPRLGLMSCGSYCIYQLLYISSTKSWQD